MKNKFIAIIVFAVAVTLTGSQKTLAATSYTQGSNSAFVAQSVPLTMIAGQTYPCSVTFENVGTTPWTNATNFHLGTQDPQDNTTWGTMRQLLPAGTTSVGSGQNVTFTFFVTAPTASGIYSWQWEMLQEGIAWFGAKTPVATISVIQAPLASFAATPSQAVYVPLQYQLPGDAVDVFHQTDVASYQVLYPTPQYVWVPVLSGIGLSMTGWWVVEAETPAPLSYLLPVGN